MAFQHIDKENRIPPRWLHCPRKGELIFGKFLPFKTPLSSAYDSQIPIENRFEVDMIFSVLKCKKLKMGLWLDLTFTKRFYDSKIVENHDCKYLKLQCRGHDETPSDDQTNAFVRICESFIRSNPLEIIGVHCTHGFNRTGWLITNYLIQMNDWSVDAAVRTFAMARSPGIYKQEYIESLFEKYHEDVMMDAPSMPAWCLESDDTDRDANGTKLIGNSGTINKTSDFMGGLVPSVEQVTVEPRLTEIRRKASNMAAYKGKGFFGSQPVSMDRLNMQFIAKNKYKVSWKADGVRYMMLIDGKDQVFMFDRNNTVFFVPNLDFPKRKDHINCITQTLVDGEMIVDQVDAKPVPRYLIYDIIMFEGLEVGKTDFERRLLCINKEIVGARTLAIQQGRLDKTKQSFSVRAKPFWDIHVTEQLLDGKFSRQVSHETDGLIFQPVKDLYHYGRSMKVLKWKPPELNSVDFKLNIVRENKIGHLPRTIGYLHVGGLDPAFSEIKLNKELRGLNGKIIECYWEVVDGCGQWKFMRQRTDKSFPNAYSTAQGVIESIRNPVNKQALFECIKLARDTDLMPPPLKKTRT